MYAQALQGLLQLYKLLRGCLEPDTGFVLHRAPSDALSRSLLDSVMALRIQLQQGARGTNLSSLSD